VPYCVHCGFELTGRFCGKCGAELISSEAPTRSPRPTASRGWYPSKKQWRVLWVTLAVSAFFLVNGVGFRDGGPLIVLAFCAALFGALLIWKLER